MVEHSTQQHLQDNYAALMMDYAAGNLDHAQSLIVAAHVELSPTAQERLCACENIGGALLQECCDQEAPMSEGCLDALLDRLDQPHDKPKIHQGQTTQIFPTSKHKNYTDIPNIVRDTLCPKGSNSWTSLMGGFEKMMLDLPCKRSEAKFIAAAPGAKSPAHTHTGLEITLVLDGAFSDQTGHYKRGDLIVTDGEIEHQISACPDMGCMCMVVTTAPIKFTGIAKLLNPFVKI